MLIADLKKEARNNPVSIVFPESYDDRILQACAQLQKRYANPILLGKSTNILKRAKRLKISLKHCTIIDHLHGDNGEKYAHVYARLRKKKGMKIAEALRVMRDPAYFGAMMVKQGDADGMISGAAHTTADTARAAIRVIGLKRGRTRVSGACFGVKANDTLLLADAGIIESPNATQLASIAIHSAETFEFFTKKKARVALLSFSTKGSAAHPMLKTVRKAVSIIKKRRPKLIVDGEMQCDAALVKSVAKRKCPQSPIQGNANVLIFPDLNAANITIKLLEILAGYQVVGPFLQSLNQPVNDLSRGSTVEDIVDLGIFTTIQINRGYHEIKS